MNGQRYGHVEPELVRCLQKGGLQNKRKRQVLARLGNPLVATLAAPLRLPVSNHDITFVGDRIGQYAQGFVVGRLTGWQINDILANEERFGIDFVQRLLRLIESSQCMVRSGSC